ncbi:MAG: glucose-1-phosphate adenylyltransferase subunit GlgD [Oscillospiraceae bacterium]|nr:glucose-1-phosphate adenylyltransferase subunit GlgD [Oscillospiraceae bacterium]
MKEMHGLIFAYDASMRLRELTEKRAVSSIPFGGRYRVIDFMLSNMVNAGITDVGVIMRENYQSLLDHLGAGKDWDLSRKRGGLRMLPPFGFAGVRGSSYRGKMEALQNVADYINRIRQDHVVLACSDLVANLPLEDIYDHHLNSKCDITAVCGQKPVGAPENETFLVTGRKERVVDVIIGRAELGALETLGVYIISRKLLESLVSYCAAHNLHDFERDVLQAMVDRLTIGTYLFGGYAAKVSSTSTYFARSMDLLRQEVRADLFLRDRPVKTKVREEASTYYGPGSVIKNCLVADGCYVEGEVENCILFRGVRIEKGASVRNSIIMQDTHICTDAVLNFAITDKDVKVNPGRMLMGHGNYPIAISKGSAV